VEARDLEQTTCLDVKSWIWRGVYAAFEWSLGFGLAGGLRVINV